MAGSSLPPDLESDPLEDVHTVHVQLVLTEVKYESRMDSYCTAV